MYFFALEMSPFLCRTGLSGAIIPSDSAQPHMKETINSIQTKLDHLYNRTQVNSIGHVTIIPLDGRVSEILGLYVNICRFRFTTRLWSTSITTW